MIRTLRNKFILIASGAILLILTLVLVSFNCINYFSNYSDIMSILSFITENNGRMPVDNTPKKDVDFHVTREIAYETRYFTIIVDPNREIVATDYDHIASVSENDIGAFNTALKHNKGSVENIDSVYFYRSKPVSGRELSIAFSRGEDENAVSLFDDDTEYRLFVFMDCTNRMYRISMMSVFSLFAGFICFVIFFMIVSALSNRVIKPVIENYEKQKQFITNAGHELKTPLAIISANTEVIEAIDGKNEWTQSILNQVKRLTGLVNELITLARLEEASESKEMASDIVELSKKVEEISESFIPVANREGKGIKYDIEDNIKIICNEKSIHELVSILIDNAVKYCDENGEIEITLEQKKRTAFFTVKNSYKNGENEDYGRFFERFYRGDTSHNSEKTAGYGIGLSMAQRIVTLHKGKINAAYSNGTIAFNVTLPAEIRE